MAKPGYNLAIDWIKLMTSDFKYRTSLGGTAHYRNVDMYVNQGPHIDPGHHTACHAAAAGAFFKGSKGATHPLYLADVFKQSTAAKAQNRWLEFLYDPKRSPWKKHLLNVRVIRNKEGAIIACVHNMRMKHFNVQWAVNLCIASRQASESPSSVELWCDLVDSGKYDEYEALFIISTYSPGAVYVKGGGHAPMNGNYLSLKRIKECNPLRNTAHQAPKGFGRGYGQSESIWYQPKVVEVQLPAVKGDDVDNEKRKLALMNRLKGGCAAFYTVYNSIPFPFNSKEVSIADPLKHFVEWREFLDKAMARG